jgi:hypothetical protein
MNRKIIVSIGILLVSLLGELLLWNYVIVYSCLLILLAYIKHKLYPIKKELLWYILICVGGAIVEIILVNFGNGWRYSHPDIFGIPFWIPIFWGTLGTTIVVLYDGLVNT